MKPGRLPLRNKPTPDLATSVEAWLTRKSNCKLVGPWKPVSWTGTSCLAFSQMQCLADCTHTLRTLSVIPLQQYVHQKLHPVFIQQLQLVMMMANDEDSSELIAIPLNNQDQQQELGDAVMEPVDNSDDDDTSSFYGQNSYPDQDEQEQHRCQENLKRDYARITSQSNGEVNVTLWQFLLELLASGQYQDLIQWTNLEGEFQLLQAEEVAKLWGLRKNKNFRMNYDKLSRALRYYYRKNIIQKVQGQKFVYRFVGLSDSALRASRSAIANRKRPRLDIGRLDGDNLSHPPSVPASGFKEIESQSSVITKQPQFNSTSVKNSSNNSPCCSCRCHTNSCLSEEDHPKPKQEITITSPTIKKETVQDTAPTSTTFPFDSNPPSVYTQWLASELERANQTLSSHVHLNRHEANMKKLSEHLRMQKFWRQELMNSETSPTNNNSTDSSSTNPMGSLSGNPFLSAMQQCIWMPVPLSMVSQLWPDSTSNTSTTTSPSISSSRNN